MAHLTLYRLQFELTKVAGGDVMTFAVFRDTVTSCVT